MKKILILLIAVLVISCSPNKLETQGPKQPTVMDTVGNIKSIGMMLGCAFAPNDPECVKLRDKKIDEKPHLSQEEYDEQNNQDWDKIN